MIKEIFAGLQRALWMAARVNLKRHGAAHHAICFQQIRHVPLRSSVRHVDEDASCREVLVRFRDAIPHPRRGTPGDQHDEQQYCEHKLQFSLTKSISYVPSGFSEASACRCKYSVKITAAATASTVI